MNKYMKESITLRQFTLALYKTQIGVFILALPRELAQAAGTDGWISLIMGWAVSILASIVIIKIMEKSPGSTIYELLINLFGKWIGKGMILAWISYTGLAVFVSIVYTLHIIGVWILNNTNMFYLVLLAALPLYTLTGNGMRFAGKYAEVVFFFTSWMYFFVIFGLRDAHLLNLLPIIKEGWLPIIKGIDVTVLPFLGFEMAFILYPYLENKKAAYKGIITANTIMLTVYLLITFLTFIYFSPDEIESYLWPTLNYLKSVKVLV